MTPSTVRPSLPGAFRLFSDACSFYASHWQLLLGINLIPVIAALPTFFIKEERAILLISISILSILVNFICQLAFLRAVVENGEPEGGFRGAFRQGLPLFFPFIWVSILSGLATLGGLVLLVIPGLMLSVWLSTSAYVLFAENRRGLSALTGSWHYVRGYFWAVLWRLVFLMILFFLIGLLQGLAAAGPGQIIDLILNNLFFIPLSLIYSYLVYRSLKKVKAKAPEAEESKLRKRVIAFALIGLVGLIAIAFLSASALLKFLPLENLPIPPTAS